MAKTIAEISDEIHELNAKNTALNKQVDDNKKLIAQLEIDLEAAAAAQGLTRGGGTTSTFTIEPETAPQIADWDEFYKFIHENEYYHLLQKRFAVLACRELWELGEVIPGVNKFTSNKVRIKGV